MLRKPPPSLVPYGWTAPSAVEGMNATATSVSATTSVLPAGERLNVPPLKGTPSPRDPTESSGGVQSRDAVRARRSAPAAHPLDDRGRRHDRLRPEQQSAH